MPLVDRMSLLLYLLSSAVLSVRVGVGDRKAIRAVSDSEPGTGGMGCSSYHRAKSCATEPVPDALDVTESAQRARPDLL